MMGPISILGVARKDPFDWRTFSGSAGRPVRPEQALDMETAADRRHRLIVVAILLVALAVRLWNLGAKSLWLDEAFSLELASRSLRQILTNTSEINPPLYYALLHGWIARFGISEVALRSLSVVFGVFSVALTGWVGSLLGGKGLARWSMALMAVMPMPVEHSQMARTYSLFLAASLASYGCLLAWEQRRHRRWAIGYVIATILMCYAHHYGIFNLLAQQLYMGFQAQQPRVSLRKWLGLSVAVLLGYLPWLVVVVTQTFRLHHQGFWIPRPDLASLLDTVRQYVTFGVGEHLVWGYLLLAVLGFLNLKARKTAGLLLGWWLCPLLVPFAWSRIGMPIFWPRYTIAAVPALCFLIGQGVLSLASRIVKGLVVIALTIVAVASLSTYYPYEEEAWRSLVATVESSLQSDDAIAVSVLPYCPSPFIYYYRSRAPFKIFSPQLSDDDTNTFDQQIRQLVSGHKRLWIVLKKEPLQTGGRLLTDAFLERYPDATLISERHFPWNLFVYGYELPVPPPQNSNMDQIPEERRVDT